MGTKHPNRQVLQIYTSQILIIFLMSNEYCCRLLSSFRQYFFLGGGGGGDLAEPDHEVLPTSSRVLAINFHIT